VVLVTTVHVASPGFYAAVQEALDRAELVLMEGIVRSRAPRPRVDPEGPPPAVAAGQGDLAKSLRLVRQTSALELRRHFVKADMGEREFRDLVWASGERDDAVSIEGFVTEVERQVAAARRISDDRVRAEADVRIDARHGFARHLVAVAEDDRRRPVVVGARNRIAMRALDEAEVGGDVAICWGFVHTHEFARALLRRGYRVAATEWRPVFRWY
jgi:hypothetical protein